MKTLADIESTCRVVAAMNETNRPDKWVKEHGVPDYATALITGQVDSPGSAAHGTRSLEASAAERVAHNASEVDNAGCDEHVYCGYVLLP